MFKALVRPLFKLTAIYLKGTLTGVSQGCALLRIRCRNTHEVTCNIILSSPISCPPPPVMCPPAHAWDVTEVPHKHLPVSGPSLMVPPLLPPSLWVNSLASRYPSSTPVSALWCPEGLVIGHCFTLWPSTDRETCPFHSSMLKILFWDHNTQLDYVLYEPTNPSHPHPQEAGLVDKPSILPFVLTPLCPSPPASLPVVPWPLYSGLDPS